MQLTIEERLILKQILPKESDYQTMKKVRELSDRLDFTDEEIEKWSIVFSKEGFIQWNKEFKDAKSDIMIGELAEKEIVEILKKKNDERKLESTQITLYEKLVEKKFDSTEEAAKEGE